MTAGLYACKWCLCRRDADLIWIERSFFKCELFLEHDSDWHATLVIVWYNYQPFVACYLLRVCKLPRVRRFISTTHGWHPGNTLPRNFEVCCGQRVFCLIWPWPLRFCSNSVISVVVLVMANIRRTVLQRAELAKLKRRDARVRRAKCPLN